MSVLYPSWYRNLTGFPVPTYVQMKPSPHQRWGRLVIVRVC